MVPSLRETGARQNSAYSPPEPPLPQSSNPDGSLALRPRPGCSGRVSASGKYGRILVTGGAGFIGSHLVERLLGEGNRVTVIDDFSTGTPSNLDHLGSHPMLRLVEGKVSDSRELSLLTAEADRVFHLAAVVGVELVVRSPIQTIENNLRETEAVLQAAVANRTPVIFASTSEVYGKSDKEWFSEEDDLLIGPPRFSRWSYACSKLMDEFLALAYHRDRAVPVTIVRLFNIVGPRQSGAFGMVLPRFVDAALRGTPLRIYGDGSQTRCFAHVADCVEALMRLSVCPGAVGEIVNVGTDDEVSIGELAARVRSVLDSQAPLEKVPYEAAHGQAFQDMPRRRPDLRKLERLTGFRPRIDPDRIIRDIAGV